MFIKLWHQSEHPDLPGLRGVGLILNLRYPQPARRGNVELNSNFPARHTASVWQGLRLVINATPPGSFIGD